MGTSRYYGRCSRTCSQCVPSVFPMCGNTKQEGEWRNEGLYREKTKCVPNVLTFFLYIALRAFFFFFFSLSVCHFFSLVKFYFFVGTAGTWEHRVLTPFTKCSHCFFSGNPQKKCSHCFLREHGNTEWEHSGGNMGK